jgi:hypothetical protein
MSAFVVDDRTINRIVTWLELAAYSKGNPHWHDAETIRKRLGYNLATPGEAERLANDMFTLNCQAVNQRYSDKPARTDFHPRPFVYKATMPVRVIQALKHLSCWLYQCSEGDIPETEMFQAFDRIRYDVAYQLIARSEDYEKAQWDAHTDD